MSEKKENTGSKLADFISIKRATLMELKAKYEHLHEKMFYRTSREEYLIHSFSETPPTARSEQSRCTKVDWRTQSSREPHLVGLFLS